MKKIIYLDNAATTQVSEAVLNEMLPFFRQTYSNPSAVYGFAGESKKAINKARTQAAELIGSKPEEIYFTGGGSESDNWALKAAFEAYAGKGKHIITSKSNIMPFCTPVSIWKSTAVKLHTLMWTRTEKFLLTS